MKNSHDDTQNRTNEPVACSLNPLRHRVPLTYFNIIIETHLFKLFDFVRI
jgi:hypothetical protein